MGLYDSINTSMKCPHCDRLATMEAQTKDIGCQMWQYQSLPDSWFDKKYSEKKFRTGLGVFPLTPFDKSHTVWKDQAEKREALAHISDDFSHVNSVEVIVHCPFCREFFWGDILLRDKMFIGEVINVRLEE